MRSDGAAVGLLLLVILASGACWGGTMTDDTRLSQSIEVRNSGAQLADILAQLSQQAGVHLEAQAPMGDTTLVVRYHGPLSGCMEALAGFFGADRDHPARWTRAGEASHWRYRLERDAPTRALVQELREERDRQYRDRVGAALRGFALSAEDWSQLKSSSPQEAERLHAAMSRAGEGAHFLRQVSWLPEGDRELFLSGGKLSYRIDQLAGAHGMEYVRGLFGPDTEGWTGGARLSFYTYGPSPYQRVIAMTISDDPAKPGQAHTAIAPVGQLWPELSAREQGRRWRERYGDPSPQDTRQLHFADLTTPVPPTPRNRRLPPPYGPQSAETRPALWGQLLMTVAERGPINLIADNPGSRMEATCLPASGSVAAALDALCQPGHVELLERSQAAGAFWRCQHGTYLVRSLCWPEEEAFQVPHRWLARWRESEQKHGALQLEDITAMAALHPLQLIQLGLWYPQAALIADVREPLRWYQRASPALKARMESKGGVSLAALGVHYSQLAEELDPTAGMPTWAFMVRDLPGDQVHLSIMTGAVGDHSGPQAPAVGVLFCRWKDGKPDQHPLVYTVPLKSR